MSATDTLWPSMAAMTRRRARLEARSAGLGSGRGGIGDPARARVSIFRAIKEDMAQIIEQMSRVHGARVLRDPVTADDFTRSPKLRCAFEGLDGLAEELLSGSSGGGGRLTPREFALALIERGYERQRILAMLPANPGYVDQSGGGVAEPPVDALEAHCATLVGTEVTLPVHGEAVVLSVCAGGHVKVALRQSGKTTFVPQSAFAPSTSSSSSSDDDETAARSIDLGAAQPIRLPSPRPARELAPGEVTEWIADQRTVAWQFQAGTLWSAFDSQTTEQLEASLGPDTDEAQLDRPSLMSITSMRASNANAIHLVNDMPKFMQITIDAADFVRVLSVGSRLFYSNDAARVVATELRSLLAAHGSSTEIAEGAAAAATAAGAGDIVLELLEDAPGWPLGDTRFGATAFALAIEGGDKPLRIRAKSADGLRRGYSMLTRSLDHQHLGVRMQRSICHGGAASAGGGAEATTVASAKNPMAMLPSCFYMDCPIHTGYHRVWYGRTECWPLELFLSSAALAGNFQPSHSRRVRRLVNHSRSDHKMLQLCRPGPDGVDTEFATVVAINDTTTVKVQLAGHDSRITKTVHVPIHQLRVPTTISTDPDLDWSAVSFAQRSSSGKVGVLFLQFPRGRVLVAKLTDCPASELAGGEVARLVGVRTPALVALSTVHGEGARLVERLRALRRAGRYEGKWHSPSKFAWVFLQEFQKGRTLKELCHEEASAAETPAGGLTWASQMFGESSVPCTRGGVALRALGRMVACDILCHNSDRFFLPKLFSNFSRCGNMANLVFENPADGCDEQPVVAIDNAAIAYALDSHAGNSARFQQYCAAVSELTARVIRRLRDIDDSGSSAIAPHPALQGVCDFFISGQGKSGDASYVPGLEHDLGEAGLLELERGVFEVVEQLRGAESNLFEGVERSARAALGLDLLPPESTAACDMCRLEPSFFEAIAAAMTNADDETLHRDFTEPPEITASAAPPHRWYLKRPALGVCKPFCRVGDRLAAQIPLGGECRGQEMQWRVGVITNASSDGLLAERATARFEDVEWEFGLADLPTVRWELPRASPPVWGETCDM